MRGERHSKAELSLARLIVVECEMQFIAKRICGSAPFKSRKILICIIERLAGVDLHSKLDEDDKNVVKLRGAELQPIYYVKITCKCDTVVFSPGNH